MSLYGGSTGGAWAVLKGPGLEECPSCGYDLRGLAQGTRCPECGADTSRLSVAGPRLGRESPLGAAPRGYLSIVLLGFLVCGLGGAAREAWSMIVVFGQGTGTVWERFLIGGGMAVAWWLGALAISMPRPRGTMTGSDWNRNREWSGLRAMVRGSVIAGLLSAASIELWASGWHPVMLLIWCISETFFVATVCWYAARVADWAPDDGLAWRFRTVAWVVGAGAMGLGVAWGPRFGVTIALGMLTGVFVLMVMLGSLLGTLSMVQGANMVRWAIRNMDELQAREERIAAKAERERIRGEAERAVAEAVSAERMRLLEEVEAKHRVIEDGVVADL